MFSINISFDDSVVFCQADVLNLVSCFPNSAPGAPGNLSLAGDPASVGFLVWLVPQQVLDSQRRVEGTALPSLTFRGPRLLSLPEPHVALLTCAPDRDSPDFSRPQI